MPGLVAVTGATGFVGGHAARVFAKAGWRVRLLCRRLPLSPLLAGFVPEIVFGSLEDEAALAALVRDCDAIVHAAGAVRATDAVGFYRANADGAARMAAAFRDHAPGAHLLLISSLSAREPTLSDYAGSKRAGEIEVERLGDSCRWTILRPPAVYGAGDRELLPFFRMAQAGWLAAPANGPSRLSLIHAADLAGAIRATIESRDCRGMTLEVDDGRPGGYGWPDIAAALAAAVGRPVRLVRLPRSAFGLAAALAAAQARFAGRPPMITRGKVREIWHADWVAGTASFRELVKWSPEVTVKAGFFETAQAYRRAGLLPPAPM